MFVRSAQTQTVALWAQLNSIDAEDDLDYFFRRPNGSLAFHAHWDAPELTYGWWIASLGLPALADLGQWSVELQVNSATLLTDHFVVGAVETDWNGDGRVDQLDLTRWIAALAVDGTGDGDSNGVTDGNDFLAWQRQAGTVSTADAATNQVPEPMPMLLATGGRLGSLSGGRAPRSACSCGHFKSTCAKRCGPGGCAGAAPKSGAPTFLLYCVAVERRIPDEVAHLGAIPLWARDQGPTFLWNLGALGGQVGCLISDSELEAKLAMQK